MILKPSTMQFVQICKLREKFTRCQSSFLCLEMIMRESSSFWRNLVQRKCNHTVINCVWHYFYYYVQLRKHLKIYIIYRYKDLYLTTTRIFGGLKNQNDRVGGEGGVWGEWNILTTALSQALKQARDRDFGIINVVHFLLKICILPTATDIKLSVKSYPF